MKGCFILSIIQLLLTTTKAKGLRGKSQKKTPDKVNITSRNEMYSTTSQPICDIIESTSVSYFLKDWNCGHIDDKCSWNSILCDSSNLIIGIYLNETKIKGSIPNSIGLLTSLKVLNLSYNRLSKTIPTSIGYLINLNEFLLSNNQFSGIIPTSIGNLVNTDAIRLSVNHLTGVIPTTIQALSYVTRLDFSYNSITKTIPTTLRNLTRILNFYVSYNELTGIIPTAITGLTTLKIFSILNNQINGPIPNQIGNLINLERCFMSENKLTGTIPSSIGNLSRIHGIFFDSNHLMGTIPSTIGYLSLLSQIYFNVNSLSGYIPSEIGHITSLEQVFLHSNCLSGPIPLSFINLSRLTQLYLNINRLSGTIPFETMTHSNELLLHHNKLSGFISSSIALLTDIHILDLSLNMLTGSLPTVFGLLSTLRILRLNTNQFTGTVPSTFGFLYSLLQLQLSNNRLWGPLPPSMCDTYVELLTLSNTSITCFPSCLVLTVNDFIPHIPHCYDHQDIALCGLVSNFMTRDILNYVTFDLPSLTYESAHPRYQYDSTGLAKVILIDVQDAFQLQIKFNPLSQTLCPVEFCADEFCNDVIATYPGTVLEWPGVGRNPRLVVPGNSVYFSVGSLNCPGPVKEWGYAFTVSPQTHGLGWKCSTPPPQTIVSISNRSLPAYPPYAKEPCLWTGIQCDGISKITSITLRAYKITGTIPSILGVITSLTSIDLSFNRLSGKIPSDLSQLIHISQLLLANNHISGSIPAFLSTMTSLSRLSLEENYITGSLPTFLTQLTNLRALELRSNRLIGKISNELCPLILSSYEVTVTLGNNAGLTCYESCWQQRAKEIFEDSLQICSPSSAPTTSPTLIPHPLPSLQPTTTLRVVVNSDHLSLGGLVGIIIACIVVFLGVMLFVIWFFWLRFYSQQPRLSEEEIDRSCTLSRLPIHNAIYNNVEINEDLLNDFGETIQQKDHTNKTVVDLIIEHGAKCKISVYALYRLVEMSLPVDLHNGESKGENVTPSPLWISLIQRDDEVGLAVVRMVLHNYKHFISQLANMKDSHGRKIRSIASEECQKLINRNIYLDEQFELSDSCFFKSSTYEIWTAQYHKCASKNEDLFFLEDIDFEEENQKTQSTSVMLKFMKIKDHFHSEIHCRDEGDFRKCNTIDILCSYDGDKTDERDTSFRSDAILKGFYDYPYCIVIESYDQTLLQLIQKNSLSGRDWDEIRLIMKQVLTGLSALHEGGFVHGNLNPSNIFVSGHNYHIGGFDGAANMNDDEFIGSFTSSSCCPPEMVSELSDGSYKLRSFERDPHTRIPIGTYTYDLIKADPCIDIWATGVLLFHLCTGFPMFPCNSDNDIIEEDDLKLLSQWTDATKRKKLSTLSLCVMKYSHKNSHHLLPSLKNLLSILLYRDPTKRPSAYTILQHPFISGKHPARMLHEKPQFDVFISYRVDADAVIAEALYSLLQSRGIRVWWDKNSLEVGKNWEDSLCDGMMKSSYFVCLLSRKAINNSETSWQNLSNLNKDSRCDNVLFEWNFALELKERGLIEGIFPLFIGDYDENDNMYSDYFKSECHPKDLPNIIVDEIRDKVTYQLDRQALGMSYRSFEQSAVRHIVTDIVSNHGGVVEGPLDKALELFADKISLMVGPSLLQKVLSYRITAGNGNVSTPSESSADRATPPQNELVDMGKSSSRRLLRRSTK